jgi:DNA-binding YbaB/EbfC family protein
MNPQELQKMMSHAQDMQRQMQEKMRQTTVEATVGGGAVTVKVNGQRTVLSVKIDPELVKSGDIEMLQDLIVAAVNEAGRKAEQEMQSNLSGLLGGMGIPPGLF